MFWWVGGTRRVRGAHRPNCSSNSSVPSMHLPRPSQARQPQRLPRLITVAVPSKSPDSPQLPPVGAGKMRRPISSKGAGDGLYHNALCSGATSGERPTPHRSHGRSARTSDTRHGYQLSPSPDRGAHSLGVLGKEAVSPFWVGLKRQQPRHQPTAQSGTRRKPISPETCPTRCPPVIPPPRPTSGYVRAPGARAAPLQPSHFYILMKIPNPFLPQNGSCRDGGFPRISIICLATTE